MTTQPYEYFSVAASAFAAFFMFLQVAIFTDKGKGWVDRPLILSLFMGGVACSLVYKIYAFARLGEHYTVGGSGVAYLLCGWQFISVLYVVTESYKARLSAIVDGLLDQRTGWASMHVPKYNLLKRQTKQGLISPVAIPPVFGETNSLDPVDTGKALALWLVSVGEANKAVEAEIAHMVAQQKA